MMKTRMSENETEQPFISHLVELRNRLLRIVLSVLLVFLAMTPFANEIYGFLAKPLMQFLPDSIYATQKGILSDMYEPIVWSKGEVLDDSEELFESEFTAVINEVSDFLTEGLLALNSLGVEVPVVGYEVMSEKNEVIGEVELAWETLKIAGVLGGQKDFLSEVDDRWLVLDLENGDDWVQQVKNRFEGVGK